jgi:hypothetical protein
MLLSFSFEPLRGSEIYCSTECYAIEKNAGMKKEKINRIGGYLR